MAGLIPSRPITSCATALPTAELAWFAAPVAEATRKSPVTAADLSAD
ncbi:hypothetical protein [Kitasatospora purpeofusca]